MNPRLGQQGHPVDCRLQDRLEVVKILGQLIKLEIRRDAIHPPRLGIRLERAQQEFARILFVIGAFIRHPQHRQLLQPLDRFSDDIEMLTRLQRHINPCHTTHLVPPHTGAIHHMVGGNKPLPCVCFPFHAGCPTVRRAYPRNPHPFQHLRPAHPRAFGQCQRDIGRVALPILTDKHPGQNVIDIQMRIALLHLLRRDFLGRNAKRPRHGRAAKQFLAPVLGQRNRD